MSSSFSSSPCRALMYTSHLVLSCWDHMQLRDHEEGSSCDKSTMMMDMQSPFCTCCASSSPACVSPLRWKFDPASSVPASATQSDRGGLGQAWVSTRGFLTACHKTRFSWLVTPGRTAETDLFKWFLAMNPPYRSPGAPVVRVRVQPSTRISLRSPSGIQVN